MWKERQHNVLHNLTMSPNATLAPAISNSEHPRAAQHDSLGGEKNNWTLYRNSFYFMVYIFVLEFI